jgi:hypothetical protein
MIQTKFIHILKSRSWLLDIATTALPSSVCTDIAQIAVIEAVVTLTVMTMTTIIRCNKEYLGYLLSNIETPPTWRARFLIYFSQEQGSSVIAQALGISDQLRHAVSTAHI